MSQPSQASVKGRTPAPRVPTPTPDHARDDDLSQDDPTSHPLLDSASNDAYAHVTSDAVQAPAADKHPEHELLTATTARPPNEAKYRAWALEIAGLCFSTLSLVALIVFLRREDGQLLSTWTFPLSVNTVVSILSVCLRMPLAFAIGSCLGQGKWSWFKKREAPVREFVAFDAASRGPMGSLSLLWWLKSWHWAALGAWASLTLLAADPFLQALVTYPEMPYAVAQNESTIGRSSSLDIGQVEIFPFASALAAFTPDIGFAATILIGFVNTSSINPTQPPSLTCSTGNCTWPLFSTLEICSSCADITSQIQTKGGFGGQDVVPGCIVGSQAVINDSYTTYSIPYGINQQVQFLEFNGLAEDSICPKTTKWFPISAVFQPNETFSFKDWRTLLASFAILQAPDGYWNNQVPWQNASMKATECALSFCGKVYNASMQNGKLNQTAVSDAFERVADSYQPESSQTTNSDGSKIPVPVGQALVAPDRVAYTSNQEANPDSSPTWISYMPTYDLQLALPAGLDLPPGVQPIFNITQTSIESTVWFLAESATLNSIAWALVDSANLTATFERVAETMSNRMREMDGSITLGTTQQWVPYIHVSWAFLSLPVVAFLFATVFSVGVILESNGSKLEIMKDDPLPVLLYGLNNESRAVMRELKLQGGKVENIAVRLLDGTDGVELSCTDHDALHWKQEKHSLRLPQTQ